MKNADMPAMPCFDMQEIISDLHTKYNTSPGLTKRELVAAMAMQGLLSNPEIIDLSKSRIAEESRIMADALLAELEGK